MKRLCDNDIICCNMRADKRIKYTNELYANLIKILPKVIYTISKQNEYEINADNISLSYNYTYYLMMSVNSVIIQSIYNEIITNLSTINKTDMFILRNLQLINNMFQYSFSKNRLKRIRTYDILEMAKTRQDKYDRYLLITNHPDLCYDIKYYISQYLLAI